MQFYQKNHRSLAAYGVGNGNAPALLMLNCVGHLTAAFIFKFLKIKHYEQRSKSTRTGARRC